MPRAAKRSTRAQAAKQSEKERECAPSDEPCTLDDVKRWRAESLEPWFKRAIKNDDVSAVRAWLLRENGRRETLSKFAAAFFIPGGAFADELCVAGSQMRAYSDRLNERVAVEHFHLHNNSELMDSVYAAAKRMFPNSDAMFLHHATHLRVALLLFELEKDDFGGRVRRYVRDMLRVFILWLEEQPVVRETPAIQIVAPWVDADCVQWSISLKE